MKEPNLTLIALGKIFYRHRSLIALPFFLLLLFLAKPDGKSILPHLLIFSGIIIRLWSAGYIGEKARGRKITAEFRIISGPYHILRHPLYIGNFFLVSGMILLFNPTFWFALLLIIIFLFEYSIIIFAENYILKNLPEKKFRFSFKNLKGEISTIIIVVIIYTLYFFIIPILRQCTE